MHVLVTYFTQTGNTKKVAEAVSKSALVKASWNGGDPNWGRILQTLGAGRVSLCLEQTVVKLCGVTVFRRGAPAGPAARRRAEARLVEREVAIEVSLGAGRAAARVWTCDLSYDYVRINAEYTT